ncbi:MAG: DeoR/GlpR family DNA-binding transcription regulator [Rhodoglobus sp.]
MSRQAAILEIVQSTGFQSVADLADQIGVNPSTIRRHLDRLEGLELVQRSHGGVRPLRQTDIPSHLKQSLHSAEKEAIGKAMADRVLDGQVIMLDSGTTTLEVAKHLVNSRLTVVTNDLRIGIEVANKRGIHLVFIGGELLPGVYTMWGPTSVEQIEQLRVDVAIFGADTVNEGGIFNINSYEMEVKRAMLAIASQAFFVADSSKFHREALFKVFDFEHFTAGISDDLLDPIVASQLPIPIIRVGIS